MAERISGSAQAAAQPSNAVPVLAAAALLYSTWWLVPHFLLPGARDPLVERLVTSALCVGMAILSRRPRFAPRGDLLVNLALWAITAHFALLVHRNTLDPFYMVGLFIVLGSASLFLRSARQAVAFSAWVVALSLAVAAWTPAALLVRLELVGGAATVQILVGVAVLRAVRQRDYAMASQVRARDFLAEVIAGIPDAVFVRDSRRLLLMVNDAFCELVDRTRGELHDGGPLEFPKHPGLGEALQRHEEQVLASDRNVEAEIRVTSAAEGLHFVSLRLGVRVLSSGDRLLVGVLRDVTDRRRLEMDLQQAQKLEAVGRLAAGVAHEINTPIQFVSDSVHFLRTALTDLLTLGERHAALRAEVARLSPALAEESARAEEAADFAYLQQHGPKAVERSIEGLRRVSTIVRSIKEFAHPDQKEMAPADLNQAITNTLEIARNEYKYVADVETDLGELPLVTCHLGEINQVLLNIIVNGAHAIADVVGESGRRGRIRVATRCEGGCALISISDTGGGIPEPIRNKVFEPFFTTKEVGRGTGQGLAIARSVVDKHGGTLRFDTEVGAGSTFHLSLPLAGVPLRAEAA